MLLDQFNRVHDYLRISITDQCNFRCTYCMPSGKHICTSQSKLMTAQEIRAIAEEFVKHGVNKIRLTGGEPLLRKDFENIVMLLAELNAELTLTTNGSLVHKYIDTFKACGIHTVNVSLDSLNPSEFKAITLRDEFSRVWKNVELLLRREIKVKLNVVAIKGTIENEIIPFIELTKHLPLHVRFIEFMPFSMNSWDKSMVITADEIHRIAAQTFDLIKLKDEPHATAKKFTIPGHAGTVAFITTMSCQFCNECNRLRVTTEGKLKNCLFGKDEYDLANELRAGRNIYPLIAKALHSKEEAMGGQFKKGYQHIEPGEIINRSMVRIGG